MNKSRLSKRQQFAQVEDDLRQAFSDLDAGIIRTPELPSVEVHSPAPQQTRASPPHRPLHRHSIALRYSVRECWGGPRFVVEYKKATISEFEAKTSAEREMKHEQYIEVVLLDVVRT